MKKFLSSHAAIPVYAYLALLVGAFAIGASVPSRFANSTVTDLTEIPDTALAGGIYGVTSAVIAGFPLILAAVVRVFAYARIERKFTTRGMFTASAITVELVAVAALLSLVWVATEPLVDAGFAWIPYFVVTLVIAGLSITFYAVAVVLRRLRPDGMAESPSTLPNT